MSYYDKVKDNKRTYLMIKNIFEVHSHYTNLLQGLMLGDFSDEDIRDFSTKVDKYICTVQLAFADLIDGSGIPNTRGEDLEILLKNLREERDKNVQE